MVDPLWAESRPYGSLSDHRLTTSGKCPWLRHQPDAQAWIEQFQNDGDLSGFDLTGAAAGGRRCGVRTRQGHLPPRVEPPRP